MEETSLPPVVVESLPPSTPEAGEVSDVETSPDQTEFDNRVAAILSMIQDDPALRDRILVELYVTIAEFKSEFSAMQEHISKAGPGGLIKMLMGRG